MNKIAIIGLGYIGLPMTAAFANVGCKVVGIDTDKDRVRKLKKFKLPLYEPGLLETLLRNQSNITFSDNYADVKDCNGILITVGTPMENGKPTMKYIYGAVDRLKEFITNKTIILKSTVEIGTTRKLSKYIKDKFKLNVDEDYYLGFCPERTIEGLALHELYSLPKIVGGMTPTSSKHCANIIKQLGGKVTIVSKPETAELCKLVDNIYRSLNIEFANEIGELCEIEGIDAHEVVSAVNNSYDRTHIFSPGLGAAGPCLIKDPEILLSTYDEPGVIKDIVTNKNKVNDRIIGLIVDNFKQKKINISYVGLAFKGFPETDDLRNSPSLHLINKTREYFKTSETLYDPIIQKYGNKEVYQEVGQEIYFSDCILFLTNHLRYKNLEIDLSKFKQPTLIIDCWNNIKFINPNNNVNVYVLGKGYI